MLAVEGSICKQMSRNKTQAGLVAKWPPLSECSDRGISTVSGVNVTMGGRQMRCEEIKIYFYFYFFTGYLNDVASGPACEMLGSDGRDGHSEW